MGWCGAPPAAATPPTGAFIACSCWLADCRVMQGRRDEAVALLDRVLALRNDVCLLSEQIHPGMRQLIGNFPQALNHLALVNTALSLSGRCCNAAAAEAQGFIGSRNPPFVGGSGGTRTIQARAHHPPYEFPVSDGGCGRTGDHSARHAHRSPPRGALVYVRELVLSQLLGRRY